MRIAAAAIALIVLAGGTALQAQPQTAGAARPASQREADLDRIADLLVPLQLYSHMVIGGIDVVYRERLQREARFVELERTYPGMRSAMMEAALAYARRSAPEAVTRFHAETRRFWGDRLDGGDAGAFLAFLANSGLPRLAAPFEIRPGETVTTAFRRHVSAPPHIERAELAVRERFASSAVGLRLTPHLQAYHSDISRRLTAALVAETEAAMQAGQRAANAHVRRSGGEPPFAEAI